MKRYRVLLTVLMMLVLAGCGFQAVPERPAGEADVELSSGAGTGNPAAEHGREKSWELVLSLEGMEEVVPATLYTGEGYSLYIPDEGWRLEKDTDDGIFEETWESTACDDVELKISRYSGKTQVEASLYIPDEGWRLEKDTDDGIFEETWESTACDDVELKISRYSGKTQVEARDAFAAECGYVFEDLLGGALGDPLPGVDEDGGYLGLMAAETDSAAYVVSWAYPAEAVEGFGVRLRTMADTFALTN